MPILKGLRVHFIVQLVMVYGLILCQEGGFGAQLKDFKYRNLLFFLVRLFFLKSILLY